MSGTIFDEWCLLRGTNVELWHEGCKVREGCVETASHDSSMAWLTADGNDPRMLIEKARGHELKISREQWLLRTQAAGLKYPA